MRARRFILDLTSLTAPSKQVLAVSMSPLFQWASPSSFQASTMAGSSLTAFERSDSASGECSPRTFSARPRWYSSLALASAFSSLAAC